MKNILKYFIIYLFAALLFISASMRSQVMINTNIGTPPPWGPQGYTEVRYYYIPDIEVYYDIQKANFIYSNGTSWVYSDVLPVRYAAFDLYNGQKVLLYDYFGPTPYINFKIHKVKYPKGYNGPPPEASPKGKIKEEGKPAEDLYKIKNKAPKKNRSEKR